MSDFERPRVEPHCDRTARVVFTNTLQAGLAIPSLILGIDGQEEGKKFLRNFRMARMGILIPEETGISVRLVGEKLDDVSEHAQHRSKAIAGDLGRLLGAVPHALDTFIDNAKRPPEAS